MLRTHRWRTPDGGERREEEAKRLIAEEAIKYQRACCYTWKPQKSVVKDVKEGRNCEKLVKTVQKNKAELVNFDEDASFQQLLH